MKKALVIVAVLLSTGCISTVYEAPDGTKMHRISFGTMTDFDSLEAQAEGRSIMIRGYKSDQVKGLEAVAEGVAKGLSAAP